MTPLARKSTETDLDFARRIQLAAKSDTPPPAHQIRAAMDVFKKLKNPA